jgi:small neutral amino acid transporter SnatA (MarC family)
MFALLNPFLMSALLLQLFRSLKPAVFRKVLIRACLISLAVFSVFAASGEAFFRDLLQARYASFLVFGGVIFLVIGLRYAMAGPDALVSLRGRPEHIAGAVAMPFMIGPGTISASILAGARLPLGVAVASIAAALAATSLCLLGLKRLHDYLHRRNTALLSRYVDLTGRLSALVIGTFAVDMIFSGLERWLQSLP